MKLIEEALSKDDLVKLFKELGIKPGMILEVHSSLSKFGHIIGGAETFNDALIEAVGYNGTIVMPMQTSNNNEPANFINPPMDYELMEKYRKTYPAFDPLKSDVPNMGAAVNNLIRRRNAEFSYHPSCAFVAIGKYAKLITSHQDLDFALDDNSPLGMLYELKAYSFLAGVDYDNMTSMHLAEYRSGIRPVMLWGGAIERDGIRYWQKTLDLELNSDDGHFKKIGQILEEKDLVSIKEISKGKLKLLRVDTAVLEGVRYFMEKIRRYK